MYIKLLSYLAVCITPALVFAQSFSTLVDSLVAFINTLLIIVAALAMLVFFYGMARYVFKMGAGSADEYKSGYGLMLWGLLVFFVMASVWGIINLVVDSIF